MNKEQKNKYMKEYYRKRTTSDPEYKKNRLEKCKQYLRDHPEATGRKYTKQICNIIKKHHNDMKNDPEHLTTDFIQKMVGIKCLDKD